MMAKDTHILTINGGSSSIKFALYDMHREPEQLWSGKIDRIGLENATLKIVDRTKNRDEESTDIEAKNFHQAAHRMMDWLAKQREFQSVKAVGHRIVYGLEHCQPAVIDDELLQELKQIDRLDPDHLPSELGIIELFRKQYPGLLQVACFDTAFHASMPRVARMFALPRQFEKKGIRRYGFHGLSYAYLLEELKKEEKNLAEGRVIMAHLGNGASLAAVKNGRSMDTSMGFTPAGGIMMGTRCGDIDPGVAWSLMQNEQMTASKFSNLINHQSGLLGVSEISPDMRDLLQKEQSDERAAEAVALFCYQAVKSIGAFMAALGGLDALVFSGGIGEHAPEIRSRICKNLRYAGLILDEQKNKQNARHISGSDSKVKTYVIPTNEEWMIAKETLSVYKNQP